MVAPRGPPVANHRRSDDGAAPLEPLSATIAAKELHRLNGAPIVETRFRPQHRSADQAVLLLQVLPHLRVHRSVGDGAPIVRRSAEGAGVTDPPLLPQSGINLESYDSVRNHLRNIARDLYRINGRFDVFVTGGRQPFGEGNRLLGGSAPIHVAIQVQGLEY
jgi:hypothetical protein